MPEALLRILESLGLRRGFFLSARDRGAV